jgi:hypothetical protein
MGGPPDGLRCTAGHLPIVEGAARHTPEGRLYRGGRDGGRIEALIKLKNWVTKVPVGPKALVK